MTEKKNKRGIYEHEQCKEACANHSLKRGMTNKKVWEIGDNDSIRDGDTEGRGLSG